jgi:hypothetical protein
VKTITTNHKKALTTKPSTTSTRAQKISATTTLASTKKIMPTQKVTTTTKKTIVSTTTTLKTTARPSKSAIKSSQRSG